MKKGQQIIFSTMIMLFVFFLAVTLFTQYLINNPEFVNKDSELLERESIRLADSLLREGYPSDWNQNTVQKVGLMTNGLLDQTKMSHFHVLTNPAHYDSSKKYLSIQHDYAVIFEDLSTTGPLTIPQQVIPAHKFSSEDNITALDASIIQVQERIVSMRSVLDQKIYPVKMRVYVYK